MERLRALLIQIRDFVVALPPGRRASFVALIVGVVGGTVALGFWVQQPHYSVLYAGLDAQDAGAVVEHLKREKIPYRVAGDGAAVEVPAGRVHEIRLALAAEGMPRGGAIGFEIFDQQTIGMTDFVQRLNYQRALQGELARTIAELDAVEAARVHLAVPQRSLFVATDRRPSASVVLKLRGGRRLTPEQVGGVVHLVAASVEGLAAQDVTVVDSGGEVLSREFADASSGPLGHGVLTMQRKIEDEYRQRIESMLERVLGPGHALARVTVALDRSQIEETQETFDPDRVAVKTEKRSTETNLQPGAPAAAAGAVETLTNEPAEAAPAPAGPRSEREDAALSYEISKTTNRRVETMGAITRISVAVLVDGTYSGEGAARTFVPRPAEEVDRYRELIKRAVGFNDERGDQIEIASVPFQSPTDLEVPEGPGVVAQLGRYGDEIWHAAGLLVVLVVAFTVVRPFLLTVASRAPVARPPAITAATAVTPELTSEPRAQPVLELARQNPEQTARVIRQWLTAGQ